MIFLDVRMLISKDKQIYKNNKSLCFERLKVTSQIKIKAIMMLKYFKHSTILRVESNYCHELTHGLLFYVYY